MKKDKKMMAMYHRVNAIMQKSDELSRGNGGAVCAGKDGVRRGGRSDGGRS